MEQLYLDAQSWSRPSVWRSETASACSSLGPKVYRAFTHGYQVHFVCTCTVHNFPVSSAKSKLRVCTPTRGGDTSSRDLVLNAIRIWIWRLKRPLLLIIEVLMLQTRDTQYHHMSPDFLASMYSFGSAGHSLGMH